MCFDGFSQKPTLFVENFIVCFFHKIPHFLQIFAENFMKILKHGGLHEKLLATINHVHVYSPDYITVNT